MGLTAYPLQPLAERLVKRAVGYVPINRCLPVILAAHDQLPPQVNIHALIKQNTAAKLASMQIDMVAVFVLEQSRTVYRFK